MNQIYCDPHLKQCFMVDLNYESVVKMRFACPQCIEEIMKQKKNTIEEFVSLDSLYASWRTISKENKCLIQETMKKIEEHSGCFSTYNNTILNSICELRKEFLYKLKEQLNFLEVEPQNLSQEYLFQIAENLSNQYDYSENFKREQEDQYDSYLQQTQQILEQNKIQNQIRKHKLRMVHQQININIIPNKNSFNQKEALGGILLSFIIVIIINHSLSKYKNDININNIITNSNEKENNFNSYQLIYSNLHEQCIKCSIFAFNQNNTKMVAACETTIKIFEFENGSLNLISTLNGHKETVSALYFKKNSNELISGDIIGTMIFWRLKENNTWQLQQQEFNHHTHRINQIIMNSQEDLIISCSNDKSIIFWQFNRKWEINQRINEHISWVISLSLNENENQLISSDNDKSILVMNKQSNGWNVIQNINVQNGSKLTFIGANQFVYQPKNGQLMQIFKLINNEYHLINTLDLKGGSTESYWHYPQVFIEKKSILINKYDNYIHIIMQKQDGNLQIQQSIQYQNNLIYGGVSNDGEYLITRDDKNQFQLRKYVAQQY